MKPIKHFPAVVKIPVLLLWLVATFPVWADPVTLDETFGTDGVVLSSPLPGVAALAKDLVRQEDGKWVALGTSNNDMVLVRYEADGSLDNSFGGDGVVQTDINGTDEAQAIRQQADGKLMVSVVTGGGVMLVRYQADGSLDTSFGTNGVATASTTTGCAYSISAANTLVQQSDGKWVVAVVCSFGSGKLMRVTNTGAMDATFGSGGVVNTSLANTLALQADGKLLVGGCTLVGSFPPTCTTFRLTRYQGNGTLDTGFGTSGVVQTDIPGSSDNINALAVQADGKILVAGTNGTGPSTNTHLVRYNADGSLDSSFGVGGLVETVVSAGVESVQMLRLQANGRIMLTGYASNGGTDDVMLLRYHADGSLDTHFDDDGMTFLDLGARERANALVIAPDGKVMVAGYGNGSTINQFLLAKFVVAELDTDGDSVLDAVDNCPALANTEQTNTDADSDGNACDDDDDNDGMPDAWESQYGLNVLVDDAADDADNDGFTNFEEYAGGTHPLAFNRTDADFNNDAVADILWRNDATKEMRSWTMDGDSGYAAISFFPRFMIGNDHWQVVALGDIDTDGDADIIFRDVLNGYNRAWIVGASGDEVSRETIKFFPQFGGVEWSIVGVGDANKDGTEDLFFHNSSNGQFRIWEMNNTGNRETVCFFSPQAIGLQVQAVDDFDGDGDADVFWRNPTTGTNQLWRLQNCTLAETITLPSLVSTTTNVVGSGDFNHDNINDLLWINSADNSQSMWGMVNGNFDASYALATPSVGNAFSGIADFDGDGTDDILLYNSGTGVPRIRWMNNFILEGTIATPAFGAGGNWSIINDRDN